MDIEINSIDFYLNDELYYTTSKLNDSLYISNDLLIEEENYANVIVNYIDYFGVSSSMETSVTLEIPSKPINPSNNSGLS